MAEPVSTVTTATVAAVGISGTVTGSLLIAALGATGAELLIIFLGAILGASMGAIASSLRGWRAVGMMCMAAAVGFFVSAFQIPYISALHPALICGAVSFFATAPLTHSRQLQVIWLRLESAIGAARSGWTTSGRGRSDIDGGEQ